MPDFGIFRGFNDKLFGDKLYAGQLPTQLGTIGSVSLYDPDYQAVLNYATSLGYTLPSLLQQGKQNKLLVDLKAAGIWSKLDTFAVFATDGNSNFALIDWKRLSQYTAVNSPTFTTNQGFRGNSTSSYINTNYNINNDKVNLSLNSCSFGYYSLNLRSNAAAGNGGINGSGIYINELNTFGGFRSWNNSDEGSNNGTNPTTAPYFAITDRISSTSVKHLLNGSEVGSLTLISTSTANVKILLGATSYGGSIIDFNDTKFAVAYLGSSIFNKKTEFYNALNTYMTSL